MRLHRRKRSGLGSVTALQLVKKPGFGGILKTADSWQQNPAEESIHKVILGDAGSKDVHIHKTSFQTYGECVK
jgi:hypothetical protein